MTGVTVRGMLARMTPPNAAAPEPLAVFLAERPRLRALAYRMLGSLVDADDVLQDAWLRWDAADSAVVDSAQAFLTTMVTRLALDRLRRARRLREEYVGEWLPEPWIEPDDGSGAEAPGDLSTAFVLMLERLTPEQRAVYVLREAMDLDHAEIARILSKSVEACRQILRRARAAMEGPVRLPVDAAEARRLADSFIAAAQALDYGRMVGLLTADAVLIGDGGGKVMHVRNPILGPDRIARFLIGISGKTGATFAFTPVRVNGGIGFTFRLGTASVGVWSFEIVDGRIHRVFVVVNPDKLGGAAR